MCWGSKELADMVCIALLTVGAASQSKYMKYGLSESFSENQTIFYQVSRVQLLNNIGSKREGGTVSQVLYSVSQQQFAVIQSGRCNHHATAQWIGFMLWRFVPCWIVSSFCMELDPRSAKASRKRGVEPGILMELGSQMLRPWKWLRNVSWNKIFSLVTALEKWVFVLAGNYRWCLWCRILGSRQEYQLVGRSIPWTKPQLKLPLRRAICQFDLASRDAFRTTFERQCWCGCWRTCSWIWTIGVYLNEKEEEGIIINGE